MSKNITVKEGTTAKNFTGVKKLTTNQMGSGTVSWVPEDEVLDYVKLKTLNAKANGTYKASDNSCDGFSRVEVNVSSDTKEKVIKANGEYSASDDGVAGYSKVTVNVPGGGGGPFTVIFLDDEGNLLKKETDVPYGGSASCTKLDGSIINGLYFKGWNPSPRNVTYNMTCQPIRGDYQIVAGEIEDSWETICEDAGAHYPLGAYKTLVFTVPAVNIHHEIPNLYYFAKNVGTYVTATRDFSVNDVNFAMHMVKVAEGEDGTISTWMSDGQLSVPDLWDQYQTYTLSNGVTTQSIGAGWDQCVMRKYLQENVFAALPNVLQKNIKEVTKVFKATNHTPSSNYANSQGAQKVDKSCLDTIWVPSMKELYTFTSTFSNISDYLQAYELSGIDYSSVFMPAYNSPMSLRTAWSGYNNVTSIDLNTDKRLYTSGATHVLRNILFGFCL